MNIPKRIVKHFSGVRFFLFFYFFALKLSHQSRDDIRCSGQIGRSCSSCGARRVSHAFTYNVICHTMQVTYGKRESGILVASIGTYASPSLKQIFRNNRNQPTGNGVRKIFKRMITGSMTFKKIKQCRRIWYFLREESSALVSFKAN